VHGKNIDEVIFINSLGQILNYIKVDRKEKIEVDVSGFPSGLYALRIKSHDEYSTKSIIINH
jgi:hypothetical protein